MRKIKKVRVLVLVIATTVLLACSQEQGDHRKDSLALVDSERAAKRHMEIMEAIRADSACQYLEGLPGRWPDVFLDSTYMYGNDSCVIILVDSIFMRAFQSNDIHFLKEIEKLVVKSDGYLSEYLEIKFRKNMTFYPERILGLVLKSSDMNLSNLVRKYVVSVHRGIRRDYQEIDSNQVEQSFATYISRKDLSATERQLVMRIRDSIRSLSDIVDNFPIK